MQLQEAGANYEIFLSGIAQNRTETIFIVGGGSIGLSTAYNLAQFPPVNH